MYRQGPWLSPQQCHDRSCQDLWLIKGFVVTSKFVLAANTQHPWYFVCKAGAFREAGASWEAGGQRSWGAEGVSMCLWGA